MLTAVGRSYTAGVMPLGNVLPRCRHFSQPVFKGIYDKKIYSKNVNLTFKGPIVATAAQKKKSSSKKSKLPPLPTPKECQQTLQKSFTIGGVGLHSGDYAVVKVKPAFAGEGRYFVRVPPGTNADDFTPEKPRFVSHEKLDLNNVANDDIEPEERAEMFLKFLQEQEDGYDGEFDDYVAEDNADFGEYFLLEADLKRPNEDPVARKEDEAFVPASISAAESYADVATILRNGDVYVMSPESLLSALEACGVDNARIEIEGGNEVPVTDGSSLAWVLETQKAGLRDAPAGPNANVSLDRRALVPHEVITVQGENGSFITFYPGESTTVSAGVDYEQEAPVVGRQWYTWKTEDATPDDDFYSHYRWKIAPSRPVFKSFEEVEELYANGLIRAGPDGCCLIGGKTDWYDPALVRFASNEAARTGIRDMMGVMAMCAIPGTRGLPVGHIVSYDASTDLQLHFAKEFVSRTVNCDVQVVSS